MSGPRLESVLAASPLVAVAAGASDPSAARAAFLVAATASTGMFLITRAFDLWNWRLGSAFPPWGGRLARVNIPAPGLLVGGLALAHAWPAGAGRTSMLVAGWSCLGAAAWAMVARRPFQRVHTPSPGASGPRLAVEDALPVPVLDDGRRHQAPSDRRAIAEAGWALLERGGRRRLVHAEHVLARGSEPEHGGDWWRAGRRVWPVDGGVPTSAIDLLSCGGLAVVTTGDQAVGVLVADGVPVPEGVRRRHAERTSSTGEAAAVTPRASST